MDIHVVQPGDTLYRIAQQYGVPMSRLLLDNRPPDPNRLAVGQSLVVQYPRETLILRPGETLAQAAQRGGISLRQLLRNNPQLEGGETALTGQELVLSFQQEKEGALSVGGYAYPEIDPALLRQTLPFLTTMAPFTYGITPQGGLIPLDDQALIDAAKSMRVRPLLHLSTLTQEGTFSNELAHTVLTDGAVQNRLAASLLETIQQKGYRGLDVDFEFIYPEDAAAYAAFIARMRESLSSLGLPVFVALVPKTSADQRGDLYEGHDYRLLGEAADFVFLMTYEWGYTYGPPMAVAPPAQCGAGGGVRAQRDPGGEDLDGHSQLRLRLDPPLPPGGPGPVHLQPGGGGSGRPKPGGHPLRPGGPVPLVPVRGWPGPGARGVVRGRPEHPCQAGAGPLPRPVRGGLLESHAPLPSELGPAEQLI